MIGIALPINLFYRQRGVKFHNGIDLPPVAGGFKCVPNLKKIIQPDKLFVKKLNRPVNTSLKPPVSYL